MEKTVLSKSKRSRHDYVLIGAVLFLIIVAVVSSAPMIYSVRYSQKYLEYKEHLQASFYYGIKNNCILAESGDEIWKLTENSASFIHVVLIDAGMGKVMKKADIPGDSDHIRLEFGDGSFLDFYRYESENEEGGDLLAVYEDPDYGPYIYQVDGYPFKEVRATVIRPQNKKLQ